MSIFVIFFRTEYPFIVQLVCTLMWITDTECCVQFGGSNTV